MKLTRKIPSVMFSQHPDNAKAPYWHNHPFVDTKNEIKEAMLMYQDLGAQEIMWDWEGKYVDESVVEKLLGEHGKFFNENPIGKELFLTFRIPNPRVESGYRLGRAFMTIIAAEHFTKSVGVKTRPLFEVILPMTETAEELFSIKAQFDHLSAAVDESLKVAERVSSAIELIPLFESVESILNSSQVLRQYAKLTSLEYIRPFCARSDPALNSGIVPTTLAIKWALSEFSRFSNETGIPTYPIIAPGSLPFRGGLSPKTTKVFLSEFVGVKTIVIQSAFRYDFPRASVKKAVQEICATLPKSKPILLEPNVYAELIKIIPWFEKPYKKSLSQVASLIALISASLPKRRERFLHIGLAGYGRKVGKQKLPRAIGFTGCCYALGIPPELIGTGRGLDRARRAGKLELVESLYTQLKPALRSAGRYLRKESLLELGLNDIALDVKYIEEYLGEELGPKTMAQQKHQLLSKKIVGALKKGKNCVKEMEEAARLRLAVG